MSEFRVGLVFLYIRGGVLCLLLFSIPFPTSPFTHQTTFPHFDIMSSLTVEHDNFVGLCARTPLEVSPVLAHLYESYCAEPAPLMSVS
jgi:hypothetical protein